MKEKAAPIEVDDEAIEQSDDIVELDDEAIEQSDDLVEIDDEAIDLDDAPAEETAEVTNQKERGGRIEDAPRNARDDASNRWFNRIEAIVAVG